MGSQLQHSIDLFNRGEFFVCHEELEAIWAAERGPRRVFLQALIHFAVAFYHDSRGNPVGASRQLRKALRKLSGFRPACEGIDAERLYRDGLASLEVAEAGEKLVNYPRMHLVHTARAV